MSGWSDVCVLPELAVLVRSRWADAPGRGEAGRSQVDARGGGRGGERGAGPVLRSGERRGARELGASGRRCRGRRYRWGEGGREGVVELGDGGDFGGDVDGGAGGGEFGVEALHGGYGVGDEGREAGEGGLQGGYVGHGAPLVLLEGVEAAAG